MTQTDQIFIIIKHRIILFQSIFNIDLLATVRKRRNQGVPVVKPAFSLSSHCIGRPGVVPALVPACLAEILLSVIVLPIYHQVLDMHSAPRCPRTPSSGNCHVGHAELLALIDVGRPLHSVEYSGVRLGAFLPVYAYRFPS